MFTPFDIAFVRCAVQPLRSAYQFDTPAPLVATGIYLSSPSLWNSWQKLASLPATEKARTHAAISKYQVRSATRCTPFGTFAGVFTATITDQPTSLVLAAPSTHKKRITTDRGWLSELIAHICKTGAVREQLTFYPSTSIYEAGQGFRYARYSQLNKQRRYELTAVDRNEWIDALYALAKNGAAIRDMREQLQSQVDVDVQEIDDFIDEMIDGQWLIPNLEMNITGPDPLDRLIGQLQVLKGDAANSFYQQLTALKKLLHPDVNSIEQLRAIEQYMTTVLGIDAEDKLQVDLHLSAQNATLDRKPVEKILKQLEQLSVLRRVSQQPALDQFRKRFVSRYEQEWVPLCLALDDDAGIGYGSAPGNVGDNAIIDDLVTRGRTNRSYLTDALTSFSLRKYLSWLRTKGDTITIIEEELQELETDPAIPPAIFPNSMYVMGRLHLSNLNSNNEDFLFEHRGIGGPSAVNLLSRFAVEDAALQASLSTIIRSEEHNADCIYAEIVHLPEGRIGNVLARPLLRQYEITYAGISGAPAAQQLPIDDLFVSVRNQEVVLVSRKHNKRVLPRLSSAHNFTANSLPVYRFLCDLQTQQTNLPVIWDWGMLETEDHLPRVVYRNIVVRRAEWKITKKEFIAAGNSGEFSAIRAWREHRHLPERVVVVEGDQELLIDLEDPAGITLLSGFFERKERVRVQEFIVSEENSPVRNEEGEAFAHELILPFAVNGNGKVDRPFSMTDQNPNGLPRHLFPRSDWVYLKIYAGEKSIERLLATTLHTFVCDPEHEPLFDQFFFVRYRDEFPHLRIRFQSASPFQLQKALLEVLEPACNSGEVWRITTDTYERELERYEPVPEASEAIFWGDSRCQLKLVRLLQETEDQDYRILLALRGIDALLNDFRISMTGRLDLARKMQTSFAKEFDASPAHFKLLNDKYRSWQKRIAAHLDPALDATNNWTEAMDFINQRSAFNQPIIEAIDARLEFTGNTNRRNDLITSYIHMSVNRLFLSRQRKYEWLLYHFLERYYMSKLAQVARSRVAG